jgi:cation transport ATPase
MTTQNENTLNTAILVSLALIPATMIGAWLYVILTKDTGFIYSGAALVIFVVMPATIISGWICYYLVGDFK